MVYTFIGFLLTVWFSGFLAHAGYKFESLLIVVVGVIIMAVVAGKVK